MAKGQVIDRRTSLAWSAAGIVGLASAKAIGADQESERRIIDCHTHFYDPSRPQGVPWPGKQDKELYRTVLPQEFQKLALPLGIVGTIVVEASPWLEDNQWLLDLAARDPYLVGVVGRLDILDVAFPKVLERFTRDPHYRGIRISVKDVAEVLKEGNKLIDHCRLLAEYDLTLDVNGGPETPQYVAKLAEKVPQLRIVINHIGNLPIDGKDPPQLWCEAMEAAAGKPNVFCKVSALVEHTTEKPAPIDGDYYAPVLNTLWRLFGENRLVFGSNWPVSNRAASLGALLKIVDDYFSGKGELAATKFFSTNSEHAYRGSQR